MTINDTNCPECGGPMVSRTNRDSGQRLGGLLSTRAGIGRRGRSTESVMPTATKTADLLDATPSESQALTVGSDPVGMIAQLAANKDVDVDKLQRLIDMQERILKHNAKAEFDAAYSQMQGEIPVITERGEIQINGQLRSKYAKLEDIQEVVRPILKQYGFAIRHRNETRDGKLVVVGILSHRSGHSEQDEFFTDSDTGAGRTAIQSLGSARSYGQ